MLKFLKGFFQNLVAKEGKNVAVASLSQKHADLASQIQRMRREAHDLAIESQRCFREGRSRQEELQELILKANYEADMMRQNFRLSQEAYREGDGATAKSFSIKGQGHERRAKELNTRAQEIRDIGKRGNQKKEEHRKISDKIALLNRKKERLDTLISACDVNNEVRNGYLNQRLGGLSENTLNFITNLHKGTPDAFRLFLNGLSNPALDDQLAREIPGAVAEILKVHPSVAGLFRPLTNRGPGARAWAMNLGNSGSASASGTAYEILAARRLMHTPAGTLYILPTDELAFGPKLQASYKFDSMKTKELLASLIQSSFKRWKRLQKNRKVIERQTVESDLQLYRNDEEIFIDFKYTSKAQKWLSSAELLGVAVALATGEIHEAHYVCNSKFSRITRERIDDINRILRRWGCGTITAHSKYSWR